MGKLDGKVALITSGSDGIGFATAEQFIAEGAYVFITGRRKEALDSAVKQIGKNIFSIQADSLNLDDLDNVPLGSIKGKVGLSVYRASKAAVRSFACFWCVDSKDRRIRVNALSPGPTDTPLLNKMGKTEELSKEIVDKHAESTVMERLAESVEIAKAVVFLASDNSSYITGIEFFVDGGFSQV